MNLDFLKDRPLVANVSGGKDSTAMALFLMDLGLDFEPVFCDTGWEHDETYAYLDYLEEVVLKKPIRRLRNEKFFNTAEGGFQEMIKTKVFFPTGNIRTCTLTLKVTPQLEYMDDAQYSFFKRGPIDEVLEWSLKNDDQMELFEEEYLSGCLTWGLCDSGLSKKVISEMEYEKLK